jgi:hypothetical protein
MVIAAVILLLIVLEMQKNPSGCIVYVWLGVLIFIYAYNVFAGIICTILLGLWVYFRYIK